MKSLKVAGDIAGVAEDEYDIKLALKLKPSGNEVYYRAYSLLVVLNKSYSRLRYQKVFESNYRFL